ncbi:TolC family protein [Chitinophaga agrisoli]|uniref:TolC family protein n=1 Tax=Chitinophaga agrisoli TaxID=2607653 RepID=A0A5B2W095_9BACT|nr:TolC family protein [Chitinophaga agrisoli]KAA2245071.1 TolC family protein [Chitinophaga agrisoli]
MKRLFLYGWMMCCPFLLKAQSLNLRDAVDIALRNNLGIQIARNNVSAAGIFNNFGYAGGLPQVSANASDQEQSTNIKQEYSDPNNNKSTSGNTSNNLSAGLNASMLLYNGGRVQNAKQRLGLVEDQNKQVLTSRAQTLIYNVALRYFDIIRQQSYAGTLETSITVSRQKLDIVKAQQSAGVANNADLFQAQVDLNTQIQNLQAQQLVIDQAKTDLLTLLTLKPDSAVTIRDTILVDKALQLEPIVNALNDNPDIMVANEQIAINEHLERETAAQRYPSLSANAGYNFSHTKNAAGFSLLNQSYGPYAGVGISIPIFNGTVYKRQQEVAGINIKNAQLQKDTLSLNYMSNAIKNWQAYNNNLQQLETAKSNYDLSGRLLALVLQRFELKQATIVEVKNAQESFENAGFLLVNVSFSAKAAELKLKWYAHELQ